MNEIITTRIYNLVDPKGTALQLRLGIYKERPNLPKVDRGIRWSFIGTKIPMPVRAHTWFNGFPEPVMLDWLKANGWALHTAVDIPSGKATVYELPKAPEANDEDGWGYIVLDGYSNPLPRANFGSAKESREYFRRKGSPSEIYRRVDADNICVKTPGKWIVDDGEGGDYAATMFASFDEAYGDYQSLLIAGYPNPKLYELKEYNDKETEVNTRSDFDTFYFRTVIKDLFETGHHVKAAALYHYAHGGTVTDAWDAVRAIHKEESK